MQVTVAHDEFLPVASPDFLRKAGEFDLQAPERALPVIGWDVWTFTHGQVKHLYEQLGGHARVVATAPLAETHKALAVGGIGITWLPRSAIRNELVSGMLVALQAPKLVARSQIQAWCSSQLRHEYAQALWRRLVEGGEAGAEQSIRISHR